jgi:hypothetical protein
MVRRGGGEGVLRSTPMKTGTMVAAAVVLAAALSGRAAGQEAAEGRGEPLSIDMDAAYRAPDAPPSRSEGASSDEAAAPRERIPFGEAGSTWLTFGGLFAYDFGEEKDYNLHAAYSHFLADRLEFSVEMGGWYFAQDGDDTGGISGQMIFRYHFWNTPDWEWSVFTDIGIGLLAAFDEVPDGGQEFNFVPRAGAGFTKRISDETDARLQVGVGWHHISNGRYTGDLNNPSRDSVMIYAGVMIPF